jgi:hypothetical protein|tara:strand:- start:22548 stop:22937 length:390 start_codon:yes stop_codon:yes gene_type:complete
MDIELDSVPVPSDYIELLEKHYDEVGPNLQYLVEWFTIRQRLPIILDLTIESKRRFIAKLASDLGGYYQSLENNIFADKTTTSRVTEFDRITDYEFDQFGQFKQWMDSVCIELGKSYPEEDIWSAYLKS